RAVIKILDREKLRNTVCECYSTIRHTIEVGFNTHPPTDVWTGKRSRKTSCATHARVVPLSRLSNSSAGQNPHSPPEGQAAGLHRRTVLINVAQHEFLQIARRAALGRDGGGADLLELLLHRRRVDGRDGGLVKLVDDRRRRAFRQKEAEPGRGLEIEPLLPRA